MKLVCHVSNAVVGKGHAVGHMVVDHHVSNVLTTKLWYK